MNANAEPRPTGDADTGESNLTGDEPMTAPQAAKLKALTEEAGESFEHGLTEAEAAIRIAEIEDAAREEG